MKLKITSDGTNAGTKIFDEKTGEQVRSVQKITWKLSTDEWIPRVSLEILGADIDVTCLATVDLYGHANGKFGDIVLLKSFDKNVRVTNTRTSDTIVGSSRCQIFDVETGEQVGAIQEITWEATTTGSKLRLKRFRFDNKDW